VTANLAIWGSDDLAIYLMIGRSGDLAIDLVIWRSIG
jgi:hypothetical protein